MRDRQTGVLLFIYIYEENLHTHTHIYSAEYQIQDLTHTSLVFDLLNSHPGLQVQDRVQHSSNNDGPYFIILFPSFPIPSSPPFPLCTISTPQGLKVIWLPQLSTYRVRYVNCNIFVLDRHHSPHLASGGIPHNNPITDFDMKTLTSLVIYSKHSENKTE